MIPFRPAPLPGSLIEDLSGEEKGAVWDGSGSWSTKWREGDGEPPMDDGDDCGEGTAGSSDWDTRKGPCKPSTVGTRKGLLAYVGIDGAKVRKIARLEKEGKAAAENAVDVSNKRRVLEERLAKQRKMNKDESARAAESAHAAANKERKFSARWGALCKKNGLDYHARGQAGRLEVYLISWLLILLWHGIN